MRVEITDDPAAFATVAHAYVVRDPFTTNVITVHVTGVLGGSHQQDPTDIWAAVLDGDDVVGLAMHVPPRPVFVSRLPPAAAAELAGALFAQGRPVGGVIGEAAASQAFAETWSALTGTAPTVIFSERMYRLERLRPPAGVSGAAHPAGPPDVGVVRDWLEAFHREAMPHESAAGLAATAQRRVAAGQIQLWSDRGAPVSLAAHSAPAVGVARLGPVFTPPAHRGRGYGAAVTAAATAAALDDGARDVVLYADLANPTSNAIYRRIGYVADHDAQEVRFDAP